MKNIKLLFLFLHLGFSCFSQNASDQFLLHDIQKQIIPSDYPFYYLETKYSAHPYWSTHFRDKSLQRQFQKQIDNTLLLMAPRDRPDVANTGNWDCEILDKPTCISDSGKLKFFSNPIVVNSKWWYSKKKIAKLYNEAQKVAMQKREKLPVYEKMVYQIHEPWILKGGKICLLYQVLEKDNGQVTEKIFVFNREEDKWVLKNTIE